MEKGQSFDNLMPIKWKPFRELEKPFRSPDFFEDEENGRDGSDWIPFVPTFRADEPAMDVYQDKKNLYIELPLGSVAPENIEVYVEDGILTVKGSTEDKKEIQEKDFFRKEISRGGFQRSIKLPVEVKDDKSVAETEKGMLKITIPKSEKSASKSKKIPVKVK